MKKLLSIIVLLSGVTAGYAQQTETRNVGSFRGVKAAEGIDVYLKHGETESLKLEVSGTSAANVITEVTGSYLKIHMKDGNYKSKTVKVYVTYVEVDKLSASSAASIYSEGVITAKDLNLSSSSAGSIEINFEATTVDASASSAGEIDLKGKTKTLTVDASSAGEIDAYDVEAEVVRAEASSGASLKVNATKELDGNASSGGSVRYRGNPAKTTTNSSSGGSVKKSD
jgi:hypothetical protein